MGCYLIVTQHYEFKCGCEHWFYAQSFATLIAYLHLELLHLRFQNQKIAISQGSWVLCTFDNSYHIYYYFSYVNWKSLPQATIILLNRHHNFSGSFSIEITHTTISPVGIYFHQEGSFLRQYSGCTLQYFLCRQYFYCYFLWLWKLTSRINKFIIYVYIFQLSP